MCGILGGVNIEKDLLINSLYYLKHRGPDDHGFFHFQNITLLHTRLSILDFEKGKQPLIHNQLVIVFNGEIYNHLYLRNKFSLKCYTNSDTETLLVLYEKLGINFLNELDGMFAFGILDKNNGILILARDRAGKKPLYYFNHKGKFGFASELNALSKLDKFNINDKNIYQFLRFGFIGNTTPYSEIFELEPGSYMVIDINNLKTKKHKWWSITDFYKNRNSKDLNLKEASERMEILLDESVKTRLLSSDLEVGAFLSGGIDSGLITAFASRHLNKIKTFTISLEGNYDESYLAKHVSEKYNTDHTVINISYENLKYDLENILAGFGEPFGDSSAIPSYYISREAKKILTVVLNGDGADELFGGYRRYVPFHYIDFFKSGKLLKHISKSVNQIMPFPKNKQSLYNYIFRLLHLSSQDSLKCYLSSTVDSFEGYENEFFHESDSIFFSELRNEIELLNETSLTGLQKLMILDFNFMLPNDLLVKMDIATMLNSLEGRSPFLGRDILEFAPGLNDKLKINGITTKYFLRVLAKKYLPNIIISQPKRGFEVPLKKWVENDLKELINDYLCNSKIVSQFIKKDSLQKLLENRVPVSPEKRAKMIWYILALEIWYKKCYLN